MRVRGTAIHGLFEAIRNLYGTDGLVRVRSALPPSKRAQLEPVVLASAQYPVEVSAALHDAIRAELGQGGLTANRKIGREAARIDFGGIYRVFIRMADYETLLVGLDRAWRRYNSRGKVTWSSIRPGEAIGAVNDVEGYTEPMWHAVAGRIETIMTLGGAKRATVTLDDPRADGVGVNVRWTP